MAVKFGFLCRGHDLNNFFPPISSSMISDESFEHDWVLKFSSSRKGDEIWKLRFSHPENILGFEKFSSCDEVNDVRCLLGMCALKTLNAWSRYILVGDEDLEIRGASERINHSPIQYQVFQELEGEEELRLD